MLPFVLAILALMPYSGHRGRRDSVALLFGFIACQAQVLLIHWLAGVWKIIYGIAQAIQGEVGNFHPLSLPLHLLHRFTTFGKVHPFGAWLVGNSSYFFPVFLALIALQAVSILAVFRTRWQRPIGVALILFHASTTLLMGMNFTSTVGLLALFLVLSPFAKMEKGAGTLSFRRFLKRVF